MPKIQRDDIDKFFELDFNPATRTIYLGSVASDVEGDESGTDCLMAERCIKALRILTQKSEAPITIIMNNPGGDWYHAMAMYDSIKLCPNEITIQVFGYVMSAGAVILQAADHREMSPNSEMMIHYGSDGFYGHSRDFEKAAEQSKKINKKMEDIFLARIKEHDQSFTRAKLQNLMKFDKYFTAEEAVSLGLADEIITI
jgi:ATP-dependent Clp protease protease subunit